MSAFIAQHLLEIIFGLVSMILMGFCKHLYAEVKNYKVLIEKEKHENLGDIIDDRLKPIKSELEGLKERVAKYEATDQGHLELIIASYRFRLVQLCRGYLKQGYVTQDQYDQVTEFYKVYSGLGGNGQARDYYEKVLRLQVKDEPKQQQGES